jgi:hypothetical protein
MSWCCLGTAGAFAQNAFWADHWTYTLDLVHNYLAVYPDQEEVRALLLCAPILSQCRNSFCTGKVQWTFQPSCIFTHDIYNCHTI